VRNNIAFIIVFLLSNYLFAQQKNIPLNREYFLETDSYLLKDSTEIHTGFKPLNESQSIPITTYDLLNTDTSFHVKKNLLSQKVHAQHLFIVKDTADKFHLTIDPVFYFEYGKDLSDTAERVYKNTRGILVRGDIGKDFSFETSFYENQATYINYISDYINATGVAPGQGRVKQFKLTGFDFGFSSSYISYSPNKHFNFQAGHGKHFVGDGYRSLLLSDNSFNYPYLRITSRFGRFQYTNMYASFMNLFNGTVSSTFGTERLFQKKAAAFQNLGVKLFKRIELGIFQGMIWEANSSTNRNDLNFHYFDPVIFVNAAQYGLNATNNILLGSTLKVKITNGIYIYSQFMLDDIAKNMKQGSISNKQGYQAGLKIYEPFKIKHLAIQAEYNQVRPYSYAHAKPEQSYTHYNQALAHPLGANFKEFVSFINYRFTGLFAELKISYASIGADSSIYSVGQNVFASDNNSLYGPASTINKQNQGAEATLSYLDFKIGYIFNPVTHFNIFAGISNRSLNYLETKSENKFVYFGIRTSLNNVYYDF
jgi:hypothetical protein